MLNITKIPFLLLVLLFMSIIGCQDNDGESARLVVKLTDAPGDYQEVNVDIQAVEVNFKDEGNDSGWTALEGTNTGVFNLLDLTNGLDTVIADAEIPAGFISQVRLILGDNNSLLLNDRIIPLKTPSGQQSGLKINLKTTLEAGITYEVLLDFDAARSVVKAGNSGNYNLKPVIRAMAEARDGAISGAVDPADVNAAVFAIQGSDTLGSSFTNDQGLFLIRGLAPGDYSLGISPEQGFQEQLITGVSVSLGIVTNVGTIQLVQ